MDLYEEISEVLLSDCSVLMLFWSKEGGWQIVNKGYWPVDETLLQTDGLWGLKSIVMKNDQEFYDTFLNKIKESMEEGGVLSSEVGNCVEAAFRLKTQNNSYIYCKIQCHVKADESGAMQKLLARVSEMDAEDVYRLYIARVITSEKNPAIFMKSARILMETHPEWRYAVIQFDVVKFKLINEQYGVDFGDEMLEYFIHTLKLLCNKDQIYARLTADLFMVVTPYEKLEDLLEFVEYLRQHLSGYKGIAYRLVFGINLIDDPKENLRKYGDGAAFARQSIKENVLTHVAFFREEMKDSARMSKFMEDNMENALLNHEFVMYLQPKYNISQEKMIGAEALVRWIHPKYGMIPPMEFVPLFEKNGFIIKMDKYIWEEACKAIRKWMDSGMEPMPISVNVSRRHLREGTFIEVLNGLVEKYDVPKECLEIEITETIEDENVMAGVKSLKDNGYTLLMDDFGSGYSSLNMLKDTQFDVIKIDRAFLQDFICSERGRKIVEYTIKMTKAIGLDMIAEGVETKEQALFLSDCGCDMAQGFYYAHPMTLDDFNKKYSP